MGLVALANRQGQEAAAGRWLQELHDGDEYAQAARQHLDAEQNLPLDPAGLAAVGRLVDQLPAPAGDALGWYTAQLTNEALRLTCQGPAAALNFPDAVCRLTTAFDVATYLALDPPVLRTVERLRRWTAEVCHLPPSHFLHADARVRGSLPLAFVAAAEDVDPLLPGEDVQGLRAALGLDPPREPAEPHLLLRFHLADVGPARVPTAFDAGGGPHFLSPAAGAPHGRTLDLRDPPGPGLREVVVLPFPARHVRDKHCLPEPAGGA